MKRRKTWKGIFAALKPYGLSVLLSVILSAAFVGLTLYIPILFGRAIDCIIGAGRIDMAAIVPLLIRIVILAAVAALIQWLTGVINNRVAYGVVRDLRNRVFVRLQILPLSYLDVHPTGSIVSRVIADADQFADGLLLGFTQLFTGVLTIVGVLVFMLTIHPGITAVVVCLTPLSLFVARYIGKHTFEMFREQSEVRAEQTAFADEMIYGQKVVKSFLHERENVQKFDQMNERLRRCSLKAIFYSSLVNPTTRFVNSLVYAGVGLTGALLVLSGGITVGMLTTLLSYTNQYTKPFNEISGVVTEFQNALACADRLFALEAEEPQIPDKADAAELSGVRGNVVLEDVAFSYAPEQELLKGVNVDVRAGQHVAIVGPTGCGKTTLINLLMRFYDVQQGSIKVEGIDIRDVTRSSLRSSYGMVLQDTWLKAGTVRDNIRLGRPDASDTEVITAAKAAHAHSFIRRMADGYDTVIGENGEGLSAGQKQLLCIARTMLDLPPVLILDEATSSIDIRTEYRVQKAFTEMMRDRTTFIVAHRLSTIMGSDLILVMKEGNIIEQGTHAELIGKNGFYAKLWNSQFAPV